MGIGKFLTVRIFSGLRAVETTTERVSFVTFSIDFNVRFAIRL